MRTIQYRHSRYLEVQDRLKYRCARPDIVSLGYQYATTDSGKRWRVASSICQRAPTEADYQKDEAHTRPRSPKLLRSILATRRPIPVS